MIDSFDGKHRFLSNFWPCEVYYGGTKFGSVEAAYQAAKCKDWRDALQFQYLSAKEAKRLGRTADLRDDWEVIKLEVMEGLLYQKFAPATELAHKLLLTGDAELVEGNWWGDTFWGVCNGKGENHLGKLLMKIRAELRDHVSQRTRTDSS